MSTIEVRDQDGLDAAIESAGPGDVIAIVDGSRLEVSRLPKARSASVTASDTASVRASRYVSVHRDALSSAKVSGGVLIEVPALDTPAAWCEYHGCEPGADGLVTLYKALDGDWSTENARAKGIAYPIGTVAAAPDWNPTPACGSGLHACASPHEALRYNERATRFVAVRAPLASLVVIDESKVKAPRLEVVAEVDVHGRPVETRAVAS